MDNSKSIGKIVLRVIVPLLFIALAVLLDYQVKEWALVALAEGKYVPVLGNIFGFILVMNEGMAWGMFQGKQWVFIVMTPIAIGLISYLYSRMPFEKKFIPVRVAEVMLIGGALGNLLDRIFRGTLFAGQVVDMFYVKCINFPVFNVADCFVSVGFCLLLVLMLFVYKDEDFEKVISLKLFKKKEDEENENN